MLSSRIFANPLPGDSQARQEKPQSSEKLRGPHLLTKGGVAFSLARAFSRQKSRPPKISYDHQGASVPFLRARDVR